MDLVRAGHPSAFEAIVQRYRKPLLAYCSRLLPASRAEDAVQQTFLKAFQAMSAGDADLNLRPWLYRIAHNASLNLLRQNGWSHEQLDENMDGVQRPDQAFELRERLRATVSAVKQLPERQRNAVLLREIDGLSYEEIASALGVGDGAVRQLLHRARTNLRAGLTAVTPIGLVERLAAALASGGADPSARVAELAAGVGAGAGAMKLGVAALATGVIATGAVAVPLHPSRHAKATRTTATEASLTPAPSGGSNSSGSAAPTIQVDDHNGSRSRHRGRSHHDSRHSGSGSDGRSGSGKRQSSSGQSGGSFGSGGPGSGEHNSGSDGGDRQKSGSDDGGTRRGGSGRDGSGDGSGGGGDNSGPAPVVSEPTQPVSDDHGGDDSIVTTPTATVPQVTDDSGDGSSGSGKDGSGSGH